MVKFKKLLIPVAAICLLLATIVGGGCAVDSPPASNPSLGEIFDPSGNPFANRFSDVTDLRTATYIVAASDSVHKYEADYFCDATDDHIQVQAALDALPATGGEVLLLDGTYNIEVSIALDSYQTLRGCGRNTIITTTTDWLVIITATGGSGTEKVGILLAALCVDGNAGGATSLSGIVLTYVDYSKVMNVWVLDTGERGIQLTNSDFNELIGNTSQDNATFGIFVGTSSNNNSVTGNICQGNSYGIATDLAAFNNTLTGNVCQDNNRNIYVSGASTNNTVVGNVCQGGILYGICVDGASKYNNIIGNICEGNTDYGIELHEATYNLVANNICQGNGKCGIHGDLSSNNNTIVGNTLTENSQTTTNTYDDIFLESSDYNNVQGNTCRAGGETNKPRYGINISNAACDGNLVKNNDLYDDGFGTAPFNDSGTNTRAYEQHVDIFMDVLGVAGAVIVNNEDLSAGVPITFTLAAQPDIPRTLSGHFDAHANITAYTIEITGVDAKGITLTETMTEADLWDWETDNAFATVTSIIMTARTGTGAGDTMDIGVTDVLGLSNELYLTGDVHKIKKNAADAVVAGAQVNATYDTYDMAVIGLAATDDFTIWFRHNLNRTS